MTVLSEQIKLVNFLKNKEVLDSTDQEGVGMVGYRDNDDDLYSSIIASQPSTTGVIPAVVMLSSLGALLKLDAGEELITIAMSANDSSESFTETFPSSIDEGEFFQSSLVNDYRHITFEHIIAIRDVMELVNAQQE